MQSSTIVIIVSESSLLSVALQKAMSADFQNIIRFARIDDVNVDEAWSATVLIVESSQPETLVPQLLRFSEVADLSRTIILLRAHQEFDPFIELIGKAGAILPEDSTIEDVSVVARLVGNGISVAPSDMLKELQAALGNDVPLAAEFAKLTEREESVLSLIAEGCSNKLIARQLQISDSTVRVHVRSVLKKLGLRNRTQAALLASSRRKKRSSMPGDSII